MIPLSPSPRTMRRYVQNILSVYERANADQRARGKAWYVTANQIASMIADGDTRMGAGVIAALSANKRWSENTKLATRAFLTRKPSGHVGDALRKAEAIMNGVDPESVLPMHLKTGNFYRCIVAPEGTDAVCIDRHAHDVAVGHAFGDAERGLSTVKRYRALSDAYRTAAHRVGVTPSQMQAITWVVWVESLAGQGTRGKVYY